jgi:hypothetical protein
MYEIITKWGKSRKGGDARSSWITFTVRTPPAIGLLLLLPIFNELSPWWTSFVLTEKTYFLGSMWISLLAGNFLIIIMIIYKIFLSHALIIFERCIIFLWFTTSLSCHCFYWGWRQHLERPSWRQRPSRSSSTKRCVKWLLDDWWCATLSEGYSNILIDKVAEDMTLKLYYCTSNYVN